MLLVPCAPALVSLSVSEVRLPVLTVAMSISVSEENMLRPSDSTALISSAMSRFSPVVSVPTSRWVALRLSPPSVSLSLRSRLVKLFSPVSPRLFATTPPPVLVAVSSARSYRCEASLLCSLSVPVLSSAAVLRSLATESVLPVPMLTFSKVPLTAVTEDVPSEASVPPARLASEAPFASVVAPDFAVTLPLLLPVRESVPLSTVTAVEPRSPPRVSTPSPALRRVLPSTMPAELAA